MKFNVGDRIRATSNHYVITSKERHWEGIVTNVTDCDFSATTTKCDYEDNIGAVFTDLNDEYFELIDPPVITEHSVDDGKVTVKLSDNVSAEMIIRKNEDQIVITLQTILKAYDKEAQYCISKVKEVKRKPKIGEYIKIIHPSWDWEQVGDILKVSDDGAGVCQENYPADRKVVKSIMGHWYHPDDDYVVLEGYKQLTDEPIKPSSDLKVGELVQIKSWEMLKKEFGTDEAGDIQTHHTFSKKLKHFCGKFAEILSIDNDLATLKLFNCEHCKESFECSIEILKKVK